MPAVSSPTSASPEFDPPDEDGVYARYLETCKHLGEPVTRDHAQNLMAEWSVALAARQRQSPLY